MKIRSTVALFALAGSVLGSPQPVTIESAETIGDLNALLSRGIEHPDLNSHYQRDLVRVKFPDSCRIRSRLRR